MLAWLKKNLAIIGFFIALFVMFACFVSGCNYHKNRFKCPEITTNTVILHDTIIHNVVDTFPYYIVKTKEIIYRDTIIREVDTAGILRDYFAYHVYDRKWFGVDSITNDSLLYVNIHDTITENRSIGNKFEYRILRPQAITYNQVDNSVHFTKYIYTGISFPLKDFNYTELSVLTAFKDFYIGIGYIPLQKGVSVKGGIRLFKWE